MTVKDTWVKAVPEDESDIPLSIADALLRAALTEPSREAVVAEGSRISYAELAAYSDTVARALAQLGVAAGEHVGICAGNGIEWAVLFHGIVRAGAVCVPINTRLRAEEIAYQLRQSDVVMLFLAERLLSIDFVSLIREICPAVDRQLPDPMLPKLRHVVVLGERVPAGCEAYADFMVRAVGEVPRAMPDGSMPALIQYTSGTTSFPKGAVLSHRSMVKDAYFVGCRMGMTASDRYLGARPFFHVAGSTLGLVMTAVHRSTMVTMARFTAEEALRLLSDETCTLTSGNDTMYLMMLNSDEFSKHAYKLRGGWAAVSPTIMERIAHEFRAADTVVAYGLSECSPNVVISDFRDPLPDRVAGWMRPHPGLSVRIADPVTNVVVPHHWEGEIQVCGWCLMQGYYNQPEATAASFANNGYLKTGDLGVMREDGRIRFVGRLKEIIRVGGENVAPTEVEDVFHQHPKIRQVQVFALPDERLVEVPGAYIVPREGVELTVDEVRTWAQPRLAAYKMPRYMAIIPGFDIVGITASSKVPKRLLIEHAMTRFGIIKAGGQS